MSRVKVMRREKKKRGENKGRKGDDFNTSRDRASQKCAIGCLAEKDKQLVPPV